MAKLSAADKIAKHLATLAVVSSELGSIEAQIDTIRALTDNDVLLKFIDETTKKQRERYSADIIYMRKRIMYQAQHVAEDMSVDAFSRFASKLQDALK